MMISEPLTWLCEEPRHSLIADRIFRKGFRGRLSWAEFCRKNDLLGWIEGSLYYGVASPAEATDRFGALYQKENLTASRKKLRRLELG